MSERIRGTSGRPGSATHVGEVEIVAREPAMMPAVGTGKPANVKTIDHILLADQTEAFQCVYPGAECWLVFDTPRSTSAHQRTHSPKLEAARLSRELEQLKAKKSASTSRRSNGIREGLATKQARMDVIETLTLSEAMKQEADKCEERALWLRSMAAVAAKLERETRGGVSVSAQELEALRADAAAFHQLKRIFGK